ncbi:MAG: hypothetical protein OXC93_11680 [Rhodospirillaceae bacterium]|nr:hypothetical protein [Rhodospirillaceae bacterium]
MHRLLDEACYTGSALHKRVAADYGFHPPANPRPNKSLCDGSGRIVRLAEARALFREGVERGMISSIGHDGLPKYVWAVDSEGRVYEAKIEQGSSNYHGYELGEDDDGMRRLVVEEWRLRCQAS